MSVRRRSEDGRYGQIAIFDTETGSINEWTKTRSQKMAPSFSHDGKKIIFIQANRERESGMTRFSDMDIYELELDTGKENRLTNFRFFSVTNPAYFPDDKQFIFSGERQKELATPGLVAYNAYREKYKDNNIFVLLPEKLPLVRNLTPVFTNGPLSSNPAISHDGTKIVYVARTDMTDTPRRGSGYRYDLFLFENGQHRRITRLWTYIDEISLSWDGSVIALVTYTEAGGERSLLVLDIKTGKINRIDLDSGQRFSIN